MGSEWQVTTIGSLLAQQGGSIKTGPFGTVLKASEYADSGTPVIAVRDIGDGVLNIDGTTPRVPASVVERLGVFKVQEGDILFGRKGAIERSALIKKKESGWLMGSDCIRLRLPSSVDPRFVSYSLRSPQHRAWMHQHSTGTTMASLNQRIIEMIHVVLPPLPEQRAIAAVLGALDDKIELNRRMNGTLEGLARALFQAWFVEFEPVRAKMEGRPTGLAAEIEALFPDGMEVGEDGGERPRGWGVATIGDLARIVGGGTPSTKEPVFWEDGEYYWTTPKDLSRLSVPILLGSERKITEDGLGQISSGLLPIGTVLLSSRAPIGYLAIAEVPTAINQGFIAMLPNEGVSNLYLLLWAETAHDDIVARANGSTFLEISKANFRPIELIVPPPPLMEAFDQLVRPLYQRIVTNEQESRTLAALRDGLLPGLMRGEVRVSQLSDLIEGEK